MDYTNLVRCPHCHGTLERVGRHACSCSACERLFVVMTEADSAGVRITLIDACQSAPRNQT